MGLQLRDKVLAAFTLVALALSTASFFIFYSDDPYRCRTVLQDGFWLNDKSLSTWQPAGCMLHTYRPGDASHCLKDRRVVFLGGNAALALFEGLGRRFDPDLVSPSLNANSSYNATIADVRLDFIWDRNLDSEQLKEIVSGFTNETVRPALTVIGIGHDAIRHEESLEGWTAHLTSLMSSLDGSIEGSYRQSDVIVVVPVIEPEDDQLSEADEELITPIKVKQVNDAIAEAAERYDVDVMLSVNQVVKGHGALIGGLYPSPKANAVIADILLNRVCNEHLPKHYPYSNTCCNTYPNANWIQGLGLMFVAIMIPAAMYLSSKGFSTESSAFLRYMPPRKYNVPLLTIGIATILCYYCDRTNILGKEHKLTSPGQFFLFMGSVVAASLFTIKTTDSELPFLNRDQADEWKGWMLVAILIYDYVGVSKTEYIYNYVRVLPTSYLFMIGFGHTLYFLKKSDYSFKRVAATLLRLNLLNVILAYAMGNNWLFYYFAPLVTWNFFLIFGTLWIGHKQNKDARFLFCKIAAAALLNQMFYRSPGMLEWVWSILRALFRMEGDIIEWRFRVTLDQYSVFPGMICAVLFMNWGSYALPKSPSWPNIQRGILAAGAAIMLGYAWFEASESSKQDYNAKHKYIGWLPCCAYVILRNSTPRLRKSYIGLFSWVGRGSLEMFLLQFHLWLAADAAGILMIGPAHWRLPNAVITTIMFVWISSLVTNATSPIIEWIMGAEARPTRPPMPMSYKSHAIVPTANGNGYVDLKMPFSDTEEKTGEVNGAVPLNGQPTEIRTQEQSKFDERVHDLEASSAAVNGTLSVGRRDLRVRVGLVLGVMVFLNWTYYV